VRRKVRRVEHPAAPPYPDIGAFMIELREQQGIAACALEFAILTAARTGEVIGARWDEINKAVALRKLDMLDAATQLADLRSPPGNRLEALAGNRRGQHSIRVNDQWRLCFVWRDGSAELVEIVDYH
jgi:toxin HigB-1